MSTTQPVNPARGFGLAIAGTVIPAGLVLGLLVLYIVYVPAAKKKFDEFGMTLPALTLAVIRVSNWVAEYWWMGAPALALLGGGNFLVLKSLGERGWVAPIIWLVSVSLLLVAIVAITLVAIELPLVKLKEGLAH